MIADTGGSVPLSPPVETQMGHGTPPVQRALDHGLLPSLSVDVETSVPGALFTQLRSALQRGAQLERMLKEDGSHPKLVTSKDLVHWATIGDAKANGLSARTGSLTPGKLADLQRLRTDHVNVVPFNDAYGAIVSGMDTSNVNSVKVGGKRVKRNGVLSGVDLGAMRRLTEAARDRIVAARDRNAAASAR